MKIWKSLNIETEYTSVYSCILGISEIISNGDRSVLFNKSIKGNFNETGDFEISLRSNRYKEFHYIGRMELVDGKIILKGIIKPKKHNIFLLKLGMLGILSMFTFAFIKDFTQVSWEYAISHIIKLGPSIILASLIIYILLRVNSYLVGVRITKKIQELKQ